MSATSKPKGKIETLFTEAQQCQIADWLMGDANYHKAALLAEKEFGVKLKWGCYQTFYQQVCVPALLARRARVTRTAQTLGADPGDHKSIVSAMLAQLQQRAFELLLNPAANPSELVAVISQALRVRDQDQKQEALVQSREKLELYREQVAERKAAIQRELTTAKTSGGLSPETIEKIERELKLF